MLLTDSQKRLIELDLEKARINAFYEELDKVTAEVEKEIGIGGYFQAEDGIVYKIVKPAGRFVTFKDIDFVRTKREDERAGTLSVKEAKEAGFNIK